MNFLVFKTKLSNKILISVWISKCHRQNGKIAKFTDNLKDKLKENKKLIEFGN